MSETTRIPHLLNAYLQLPPEASLLLLTGVINATPNWLLLRYLLSTSRRSAGEQDGTPSRIVFVSFLRDWEFWRDGARKIGLDLQQAVKTGHLSYVDGLSQLFGSKTTLSKSRHADSTLPTMMDESTAAVEAMISQALQQPSTSGTKPLLVLDGLDFLLAATQVTSTELLGTLMTWRENAFATILAISADSPLLHTQQTPIEIEHAAFTTSLIHQAYFVISLRLLSTGAARDVSGVLRVTKGGAVDDHDEGQNIEEKEVLYLVGGDGGVKVFERGAG